MKTNALKTLQALAAICLIGLSTTLWADTLDTILQRKKILIAVDIGAPPYGFLDTKAQPAGSDVEAAQKLAKDLGVALEIVPVTGSNRVPFLLTKKADIVMASFSITDERKKAIDFSNAYGVVPIVVAGPKSKAINGFADLAGQSIAVTRGTTSDQALTRNTKNVPSIKIICYEDDAPTNTAVATGQQDYLAAAPSVIPAVKQANPTRDIETKFVMESFPYGVGLRKNVECLCREGMCGTCETRILDGEAQHFDQYLSDAEKAAQKTMMICVSRAKGQRIVLDL